MAENLENEVKCRNHTRENSGKFLFDLLGQISVMPRSLVCWLLATFFMGKPFILNDGRLCSRKEEDAGDFRRKEASLIFPTLKSKKNSRKLTTRVVAG